MSDVKKQSWFEKRLKSYNQAFSADYFDCIEAAVTLLVDCFANGNKLLVCGNGGSAADAQHITAELVGKFLKERKGLPAISLTTNTSVITAWSNDYNYDSVFARQVETLGKKNDVLLAISTSGCSHNILKALKTARQCHIKTIGLAGNDGGKMRDFVDYPLFISETHTPYIQEVHLITYHQICEQIECYSFSTKT